MKAIVIRDASGNYLTTKSTLTPHFGLARIFQCRAAAEKKLQAMGVKGAGLGVHELQVECREEIEFGEAMGREFDSMVDYKIAIRYDGPSDCTIPYETTSIWLWGTMWGEPLFGTFVGVPRLFDSVVEANMKMRSVDITNGIFHNEVIDDWVGKFWHTNDDAERNFEELSQVLKGKNLTVCLMA